MNNFKVKKFLSSLIAVNTSNPPGNETEAADFLFKFLKGKAKKIKLIGQSERKNIVAFFGNLKSDNILLFNGHLDTVSFDKNEWRTNPLKLVEEKGYYYGRGVADTKGGITACIFAILRAEKLGYLKSKQVIFIGSADEETGASSKFGSKIVVDYFKRNKIKVKGGIILEPSDDEKIIKINLGHRGLIWLKAKSFGKTGHAGLLQKENSAILKMQRFIESVYNLFPKNPKKIKGIPQSSVRITFIKSGCGKHYNVMPGMCEANFDIRVSPLENNIEIINKVVKIAKKTAIKTEIIKNTPSGKISKNEKIVRVFEKILKAKNQKYKFNFTSPTCDQHWYIDAGIPAVNGMGPVGKNIHAPNERISIKSLFDGINLFVDLIREF